MIYDETLQLASPKSVTHDSREVYISSDGLVSSPLQIGSIYWRREMQTITCYKRDINMQNIFEQSARARRLHLKIHSFPDNNRDLCGTKKDEEKEYFA